MADRVTRATGDLRQTSSEYQQFYKKTENKLARMQRGLSHKVKGSNDQEKWRRKLSKQHGHVANQRLVNTYDFIL